MSKIRVYSYSIDGGTDQLVVTDESLFVDFQLAITLNTKFKVKDFVFVEIEGVLSDGYIHHNNIAKEIIRVYFEYEKESK